ncbi:hypothetical protein IscW_ISCW001481, partial [Ixodes scapularis]
KTSGRARTLSGTLFKRRKRRTPSRRIAKISSVKPSVSSAIPAEMLSIFSSPEPSECLPI